MADDDATEGWPTRPPVLDALASELLHCGEVELLGRMPWSSNATYLTACGDGTHEVLAIYKPRRGERPLWDFPHGTLCDRELATYLVSDALGWRIVPETTVREGPLGEGMFQRFVDHDADEHYFTLLADHEARFRRFACFDVVVNNADRKGGHVLRARDGHIWGIDHGLTFHHHWKLRTVIWEFANEPLEPRVQADLDRLATLLGGALGDRLGELLAAEEVAALGRRVERLLARKALPEADPGHHAYPWPLV